MSQERRRRRSSPRESSGATSASGKPKRTVPLRLEELEARIAPTLLAPYALDDLTREQIGQLLARLEPGLAHSVGIPTGLVHTEVEGPTGANDSPAGAEDVSAALTSGTTFLGFPAQHAFIEGRLANYTDVDIYAVDLEAGATLMAFTAPEGNFLQPVAVILDPVGNIVQASYSLYGEAYHTATLSGTYYLAIASYPAFSLNPVGLSAGNYEVELVVVPRPSGIEPQVLFLDFNGSGPLPGVLEFGPHNAFDLNALDPITNLPIAIYEYAGTANQMIADITTSVQARFDALDLPITVVNSLAPPPSGDYSTTVITDWAYYFGSYSPGLLGIAALPTNLFDHGNLDPSGASLVFADEVANFITGGTNEVEAMAYAVVHEIGHSFGFRHVFNPIDIMAYIPDPTDPSLTYDLSPLSFWQYYPGEELLGLQNGPELAYYGFLSGTMFQETESSLAGGPANDTIASAESVSLSTLADLTAPGVNVLGAFQHGSPDTDVYAVPLSVGASLDLEIFGPRYHDDPELLSVNDDLSFDVLGFKADTDSAITWTAHHSGTYYLAVAAYPDLNFNGINDVDEGLYAGISILPALADTIGTYNVSIQGVDQTAGSGAYVEAIDFGEAGNTTGLAGAVGSASGAVSIAGSRGVFDVDYYSFTVQEGQTLRITVDAGAASTLDTVIGLFGPNGRVDTTIEVFDPTGTSLGAPVTGLDPAAFLPPVASAGVYYIAVTGDGGGYGVPYNLRIEGTVPALGVPYVTDSLGNPVDQLLNFGDVGVGIPRSADVLITNVGYAAMTITGLVSSDPAQVTFVAPIPPQILAIGGSLNVHTTYNPTGVVPLAGTLTIGNDAAPPIPVALTGDGQLGRIHVVEGLDLPADGNLYLGPVLNDGALGRMSQSPLLISNVGVGVLEVTGATFATGTNFDLDYDFGVSGSIFLQPGQSRAVNAIFDPVANGGLADSVTFASTGNPDAMVLLSGYGLAPGSPSIGAGALLSSLTFVEGDGDTVFISISGTGAADLGFGGGGDLDFVALTGASASTRLTVDVRTAVGDGLANVGEIYGLGGQSLGQLSLEGDLEDLVLHGSLGRAAVTGMVSGDVFVQNGVDRFSTGGDLGQVGSLFFAGNTVNQMTIGARGSGADLYADMVLGGSLNRLMVADEVTGDMFIAGHVGIVQVGGQLGGSGTVEVQGNLQQLTVGSSQAPADMVADLYVAGDLGSLLVSGELSGNVMVGGATGTLTVNGPATADHITILANLDAPGDMDFFSFYAEAGTTLIMETDTAGNFGPPDTIIALFDSGAIMVAGPNDDGAGGYDSFLTYDVTVSGTYTLGVTNYGNFLLGAVGDFNFDGLDDLSLQPTDFPGHYTATIEGAASGGIVLDAGAGHNDSWATAQDVSGSHGVELAGSLRQLTVGGRGVWADVETDIQVWGDLGRGAISGALLGDLSVGGNTQGLSVMGNVAGDLTVLGNLQQLVLGGRGLSSDLLGNVLVGGGLRSARLNGDIWGDVDVLGSLGTLQTHFVHGDVTVAGDLGTLRTTSLILGGSYPWDYFFQGGGLPDGTLTVLGTVGRLQGA